MLSSQEQAKIQLKPFNKRGLVDFINIKVNEYHLEVIPYDFKSLHERAVAKLVDVNQIIINCCYYLKGNTTNQMLKILDCANIWFSRFPDIYVKICFGFAVDLHSSLHKT